MKEINKVTIKYTPFWKKLLCFHRWVDFGTYNVYQGIAEQKANLPIHAYAKFICEKCSKIKKIEI